MNTFGPEGNFGHMLGRTSRAMLNMLQKQFRQAGFSITVEQWTLLINIRNAPASSQQQLAELVHLDKTTIARVAAGLEKKGLIRRAVSRDDRRQKSLVITRRGTDLLLKLKPVALDVQKQVLAGLGPEKLTNCREVLRQVYTAIVNRQPLPRANAPAPGDPLC